MDQIEKCRFDSIQQIFNTMDYKFKKEEPTLALQWIKTNQSWINDQIRRCSQDKLVEINVQEKNGEWTVEFSSSSQDNSPIEDYSCKTKWSELLHLEKFKLMQKLAMAVEENSTLFAQLDALQRNVLFRDVVEFEIPYLIKYFRKCANLSADEVLMNAEIDTMFDNFAGIQTEPPLIALCSLGTSLLSNAEYQIVATKDAILVSLLLLKIYSEIGFPLDVFSIRLIENTPDVKCMVEQGAALVCHDVDVNTAVEGILEATLSHQGLAPWSIKRILIEEPVYNEFINTLSRKLNRIKFGAPFDKDADASKITYQPFFRESEEVINAVKKEGLKVIRCESTTKIDIFKPTFILGRPNWFLDKFCKTPVATIEEVRTVEEATRLLGNTGVPVNSVSVWTDSICTSQKVISLLSTPTVWLNVHGLLDPTIPFYRSGIPTCVNNDLHHNLCLHDEYEEGCNCYKKIEEIHILPKIKTAHNVWSTLQYKNRSTILLKIVSELNALDKFPGVLRSAGAFSECEEQQLSVNMKGHSIIINLKARGILAFHPGNADECDVLKVILKILLHGNCVIIIENSSTQFDLIKEFVKNLQENVQTVNIVQFATSKEPITTDYAKGFEKAMYFSNAQVVWYT